MPQLEAVEGNPFEEKKSGALRLEPVEGNPFRSRLSSEQKAAVGRLRQAVAPEGGVLTPPGGWLAAVKRLPDVVGRRMREEAGKRKTDIETQGDIPSYEGGPVARTLDVTGIPREAAAEAYMGKPAPGLAAATMLPGAVGAGGALLGIASKVGRAAMGAARGSRAAAEAQRAARMPTYMPGVTDIPSGAAAVAGQLERGAGAVPSAEIGAGVQERERIAKQLIEYAAARSESEAAAARVAQAEQVARLRSGIQAGRPEVSTPRELGEIVGGEVRATAAAQKAAYGEKYASALSHPGEFATGAFEEVGAKIKDSLAQRQTPLLVDPVLTPAASRAITQLNEFGLSSTAETKTLQSVDQLMKKLNFISRSASTPTDKMVTRAVINELKTHLENRLASGLFSGEDKALKEIKEANAAYSAFRKTFTPQGAGDDVGLAMRKIVERDASPEEIANMVLGSRTLSSGLPVRLFSRLKNTLGENSQAFNAIRQSLARRHFDDPDQMEALARSSLGMRAFSNEERAAMHAHAKSARELESTIEQIPETVVEPFKRGYAMLFEPDIGGSQGIVFQRIIKGTATTPEIEQAIFGAIATQRAPQVSRMIQAIEGITGADSEAMAAIRQGVWSKLSKEAGVDPTKSIADIDQFLNGSGREIAQSLYDANELALQRRFLSALKVSQDSPKFLTILRKYQSRILAAIGFATHGPVGAVTGYGASSLLDRLILSSPSRRFAKAFNPYKPKTQPRLSPPSLVGP